nr:MULTISPECIES: carbohydrate kinase [unclassified Clostridium]
MNNYREAQVDFIPMEIGVNLKNVSGFFRLPSGAPVNVACCVKKLGGKSQIITKIGNDPFGEFLEEKISHIGIDIKSIFRSEAANTGLSFASLLHPGGKREFSFYRKPSADMLLDASEIDETWFKAGDILHFCSMDLVDAPVRSAHDKAIRIAKEKNITVSFDVNVRLPLWDNHNEYRKIINKYIDKANILKISNKELEFVTKIRDKSKAIESLRKRVDILVYTKGNEGAYIYTKNSMAIHKGFKVNAIDVAGAGDCFIGAVLYKLLSKYSDDQLGDNELREIITFANAVGALVVMRRGTIDIMPTLDEVDKFLEKYKK